MSGIFLVPKTRILPAASPTYNRVMNLKFIPETI